jgi:peptide-methionine (S)-S-oxide reductase
MQAALSRRGAVTATTTSTSTALVNSSSKRRAATVMAASGGNAPNGASGGGNNGAPRPSLLSHTGGRVAVASVVCAAGLFSWLSGNKSDGDKPAGGGKYGDILAAARKPQGCQPAPAAAEGQEQIALASGCFWGSELVMQRVPGVVDTKVGYTQGEDTSPTYDAVCMGYTGHTEAVLVTYDKASADLELILDEYLANFDPTTRNRQGGDRGTQYRSGVYYYTEAQRQVAERKLAEADAKARSGQGVTRSGRRWEGASVVVELKPAEGKPFFVAEAYHQKYLERGGRFGRGQSAAKGDKTPIRCYG